MNEHIDMSLNMGFLEAEQKGENVTPAFDFGSFAVSDDDTNAVFENCADCGILSRIDPSSGKRFVELIRLKISNFMLILSKMISCRIVHCLQRPKYSLEAFAIRKDGTQVL